MARSFKFWKNFSFHRNVARIEGVIDLSAAAAVESSTEILGASVAKTGTGEYTVTLERPYKGHIACVTQFESSTDVDIACQLDSIDVTSASKTIVIKTMAGAVPTDVSAAASIHIYLSVKQ